MDEQLIPILQMTCCAILFFEYIPQIRKIIKRKSVEDLSLGYWIWKGVFTLLTVFTLTLADTSIISYVSQLVSICLITFVTILIFKYKQPSQHELKVVAWLKHLTK